MASPDRLGGPSANKTGGLGTMTTEGEAQPLLGLASGTAPGKGDHDGGNGDVGVSFGTSSPAFFPESSLIRVIFLRSPLGQKVRARLCMGWGMFSLAVAFAVLKIQYGNSSARSFFVAATTLTTIGYGMSDKDSSTSTYPFLSVFFVFFVLPFSFFQSVVFIDAAFASAGQLSTRIAARCRRGSNAAAAFVAEFWSTIAVTAALLSSLLVLGTVCYSYFGKQTSWRRGIFYAITSATTIGYGSFEVNNDYGYWAVGLFAITCNYAVAGLAFPSLAAFFVAAGENIDKVARIRREEAQLSNRITFSRDKSAEIA